MKYIYTIILFFNCFLADAQEDSTTIDSTSKKFEVYSELTVASSNYARGINFGFGPSIQPFAGIAYKKFALEFFGAITSNGAYNLGTGHDISLSYKNKSFTFGVHDYYFVKYSNTVETEDYFFRNYGDLNRLSHFYEFQTKYENDLFYILAGYNFYNASLVARIDTKETLKNFYGNNARGEFSAVYLEGVIKVNSEFAIMIAGLTGPSELNFYLEDKNYNQYKGGFTSIGFDWGRSLNIKSVSAKLKTKFYVNPSYRYILNTPSLNVQRCPFIIFVSLTI